MTLKKCEKRNRKYFVPCLTLIFKFIVFQLVFITKTYSVRICCSYNRQNKFLFGFSPWCVPHKNRLHTRDQSRHEPHRDWQRAPIHVKPSFVDQLKQRAELAFESFHFPVRRAVCDAGVDQWSHDVVSLPVYSECSTGDWFRCMPNPENRAPLWASRPFPLSLVILPYLTLNFDLCENVRFPIQ